METIEIELLFILFLFVCIGAYWVGRKKEISLLRCLGRNGSIVLGIIILIYSWLVLKDFLK